VKKGVTKYAGSIGAAVLGKFCPICYPATGAFLSAIGAGVAVTIVVLKVMLVLFLAIALLGLWRSGRTHHNRWPMWIAVASAVLIYAGKYFIPYDTVFYAGVLGFVIAIITDIRSARITAACTACIKSV